MIKGLAQYKKRASDLDRSWSKHASQQLQAGANQVLQDSNSQVPVDTGNLRQSGKVVMEETPRKITAEIEYTEDYAVFVHENLEARHTNGNAKFLQNAIVKNRRNL